MHPEGGPEPHDPSWFAARVLLVPVLGATGPVLRLWHLADAPASARLVTLAAVAVTGGLAASWSLRPLSWRIAALGGTAFVVFRSFDGGFVQGLGIALVGTVLAFGALIAWRPTPTSSPPANRTGVVAAAIIAIGGYSWYGHGERLGPLLLAAGALATLEVGRRNPPWIGAAEQIVGAALASIRRAASRLVTSLRRAIGSAAGVAWAAWGSDRRGTRPYRWALASVLTIGLVARVALALRFATRPVAVIGDQATYLGLAQHVANGDGLTNGTGPAATHMPLYPLFLAAVVRLQTALPGLGSLRGLVGMAQAALGTGTIWCTASLARRLTGERAGLVAAAIVSLWPPFLLMTPMYLSETLLVLLLTAGVTTIFGGPPSSRRTVTSGLLLGLAVLTRPIAAVPVAVLAIWIVWTQRPMRRARVTTAQFLLTITVVLSPWLVRNLTSGVGFVPLTTTGSGTQCVASPALGDLDHRRCGSQEQPFATRLGTVLGVDDDALHQSLPPGGDNVDFARWSGRIQLAAFLTFPTAVVGFVVFVVRGGTRRWLTAVAVATLAATSAGAVVSRSQELVVPMAGVAAGFVVARVSRCQPLRAGRQHEGPPGCAVDDAPPGSTVRPKDPRPTARLTP